MTQQLERVCIETPLAGDYATNTAYARACMLDALTRGEAPYLGHLLYPQVLDDQTPLDRDMGIRAHLAWMASADRVVFYIDRGVSRGMHLAVAEGRRLGKTMEVRTLGEDWAHRYIERPTHLVDRRARVIDALRVAGDRRDWNEINRLEAELDALEGSTAEAEVPE